MAARFGIETIRGHSFCPALLGDDAVVVDMGAHKGEFAREVGERFACHCHMVEALPALYDAMSEEGGMRKYNFAMAGQDGFVSLGVSENPEANSIVAREGAQGWVRVEGVTLATFMARAGLERIDLLKVDIEGAEIALIESAGEDELSRVVQMTVEFHDFLPGLVEPRRLEAVRKKMRGLGFYVIKFSGRLNTDVLFLNRRFCHLGLLEYWYMKYVLRYARGLSRIVRRSFAVRRAS
ncbi:MAG TPA: FkbM family methyltransferase [Gallionella sp.]|nr:FkbM family methyltransferase [Gallionella sp.]